jgi:hypothetical protein
MGASIAFVSSNCATGDGIQLISGNERGSVLMNACPRRFADHSKEIADAIMKHV